MLTQSSGPTVYAGGEFYQAPFTPRSLAGRTGRGDTCFSAYIARRLTAGPAEATRWAAAVTTLKQETPGPWQGTVAEAEALMRPPDGGCLMPSTRVAFYGPNHLNLPAAGGLLMVRHAERPPILTPEEAYFTDLTEGGRGAARAFGTQLGKLRTIGEVFVSPVSRCVHTAQEILQGALDGTRPHPAVVPLPVLHFDQKLTGIPGLASIYFE